MVEIKTYHLSPTDRVPNSPRPLLHYKKALPRNTHDQCSAGDIWGLFQRNGWDVAWLVRYGPTQRSHYHSRAHETMAVLSGSATIRFGAGDTDDDLQANTQGGAWESGGVEVAAEAGDVFVIPSGVAHKTFNAMPEMELSRLSPGTGHGIEAPDPRAALAEIRLSGFTMMGAYSGGDWDFVTQGGDFEKVWAVPKPARDPVFGDSRQGLCALWPGSSAAPCTTSSTIST